MKAREIFTEGSTDGRPVNVNVTVTLDSARLSQNIENVYERADDSSLEWQLLKLDKQVPGTLEKYKQFQAQLDAQMTDQLHKLTVAYRDTAHLALADAQQKLIALAQQLLSQNGQQDSII